MKHLGKTKSNLILSLLLIGLLISNNIYAQITTNGTATSANLINLNPVRSWNSGTINSNSLTPQTGNNKVWNNVKFIPGKYEITLETFYLSPNNRDSKDVKVRVKGLYRGLSDSNRRIDEFGTINSHKSTKTTFTGEVIIREFNYKTSQAAVNYGKVKIRVFKGDVSTNLRFRISLRIISSDTAGWDSKTLVHGNKSTTSGVNGNVHAAVNAKTHTKFKSKTDVMKVKISKTGGKAKTLVKVYTSTTINGTKTFKTSYEFKRNASNTSREITINNVLNRYIHVELNNQSSALFFNWRLFIYEKYDH